MWADHQLKHVAFAILSYQAGRSSTSGVATSFVAVPLLHCNEPGRLFLQLQMLSVGTRYLCVQCFAHHMQDSVAGDQLGQKIWKSKPDAPAFVAYTDATSV